MLRLATNLFLVPSTAPRYLVNGVFLALLLATGCVSSDNSESADSADSGDSAEDHRVPPDFRMMLGQGGGVTGRWSGFTIDSDGSIVEWSGAVAGSNPHPAGTLTLEQAAAIWHDVVGIEFFSQEIDERGEMTAFLKVNADSLEHRVSWIPGAEDMEPPKHPVEALYWRTLKIALAAGNTTGEE